MCIALASAKPQFGPGFGPEPAFGPGPGFGHGPGLGPGLGYAFGPEPVVYGPICPEELCTSCAEDGATDIKTILAIDCQEGLEDCYDGLEDCHEG